MKNNSLNYYLNSYPDEGCELSKTCEKCPYVSGNINFTVKCKEEYLKGIRGLVAETKNSILYSLFISGYSITILARVFNMKKPTVRKAIAKYAKGGIEQLKS